MGRSRGGLAAQLLARRVQPGGGKGGLLLGVDSTYNTRGESSIGLPAPNERYLVPGKHKQ